MPHAPIRLSTAALLLAATTPALTPALTPAAAQTSLTDDQVNSASIPGNVLIDTDAAGGDNVFTFTNLASGSVGDITYSGDANPLVITNRGSISSLAARTDFLGGTPDRDDAPVDLTLTSSGSIGSNLILGGGDDTLTLVDSAQIGGRIIGDAGNNQVIFDGTAGAAIDLGRFEDIQRLVKNGDGDWAIFNENEDSPFTGFGGSPGVQVNAGTLSLFGTLRANTVNVDAGATFAGTGDVEGNLTLDDGAILTPVTAQGNIGRLQVDGDLTLGEGVDYVVDATSTGAATRVDVDGDLNNNGSLDVVVNTFGGNFADSTTYVILSANAPGDTIGGTFNLLSPNPVPFLDASLDGTGNQLLLTLQRNANSFLFRPLSGTRRDIAEDLEILQSVDGNPDVSRVAAGLQALNTTDADGFGAALDTLTGDVHAAVPAVLATTSRAFNQSVLRRVHQLRMFRDDRAAGLSAMPALAQGLDAATAYDDLVLQSAAVSAADARRANRTRAATERIGNANNYVDAFISGPWVEIAGGTGSIDGDSGDVDYDLYGVFAGYDFLVSNSAVVGASVGYLRTDIDQDGPSGGDGEVDSVQFGLYASIVNDAWTYTAALGLANNSTDVSRTAVFGPAAGDRDSLSADYDGQTLSALLGAAYTLEFDSGLALEPFVRGEYVYSESDSFDEDGGAITGLSVDETSFNALYATAGARLYTTLRGGTWTLTPELRAAAQFDLIDDDAEVDAQFQNFGDGFSAEGVDPADFAGILGAGLAAQAADDYVLRLDYNGRFSGDQTDHQLTLALQLNW